MSRCLARERADAEAFADDLEAHEYVLAVDVMLPGATPTDRFELDIVLAPEAGGIVSGVADYCARHSLTIRSAQPQGDHWRAFLVV